MAVIGQPIRHHDQEFLSTIPSKRSGLNVLGAVYVCAAVTFDLHFTKGAISNILLALALLAIIIYHYAHARSARGGSLPGSRATLLAHDWAYLSYFILALLSAVWSVAPEAAIAQGLPMIIPWLSALLLYRLNPAWLAGFVAKLAIVAALLSLLMTQIDKGLAYQPVSTSGSPELRGIFAHQLFLGAFLAMAIGLILITWLNGETRQALGRISPAVGMIVILLGGVALIAWARLFTLAALLAFVLTWFLSKRGSRKFFAFLVFPMCCYFLASNFDRFSEYLRLGGFDITLSGRTVIWEKTLAAMRGDTATFGHGFGTFQLPMFDNLWSIFRPWRPWHAHNCFINVYFELGLIGLVVVLALIVLQLNAAWRYSVRSNKYSYSMFLVLFCAFGGLLNGREYDGFITPSFCLMLLFLAIESRTNSGCRDECRRRQHS